MPDIFVSRGVMRLDAFYPTIESDPIRPYVARVPMILVRSLSPGIHRDRPYVSVNLHDGACVHTWASIEGLTEALERYYGEAAHG